MNSLGHDSDEEHLRAYVAVAEPPRLLLGRESMVIQGFPLAKFGNVVARTSELVMAGLGGNMMASGVLLAIIQTLFAAVPWSGVDAVGVLDDDVDNAMQIFNMALGDDDVAEGAPEGDACDLQQRVIKRRR